jgi:hypothetical protein
MTDQKEIDGLPLFEWGKKNEKEIEEKRLEKLAEEKKDDTRYDHTGALKPEHFPEKSTVVSQPKPYPSEIRKAERERIANEYSGWLDKWAEKLGLKRDKR